MLLGFVTVKVTHSCVSVPEESCGSIQRCVTKTRLVWMAAMIMLKLYSCHKAWDRSGSPSVSVPLTIANLVSACSQGRRLVLQAYHACTRIAGYHHVFAPLPRRRQHTLLSSQR